MRLLTHQQTCLWISGTSLANTTAFYSSRTASKNANRAVAADIYETFPDIYVQNQCEFRCGGYPATHQGNSLFNPARGGKACPFIESQLEYEAALTTVVPVCFHTNTTFVKVSLNQCHTALDCLAYGARNTSETKGHVRDALL